MENALIDGVDVEAMFQANLAAATAAEAAESSPPQNGQQVSTSGEVDNVFFADDAAPAAAVSAALQNSADSDRTDAESAAADNKGSDQAPSDQEADTTSEKTSSSTSSEGKDADAKDSIDSTDSVDSTDSSVNEDGTSNFDDLLQALPSNEELLARNPRISAATKNEITGLADMAREARESLDVVGGKDGATVLGPVWNLLTKPELDDQSSMQAFGSLVSANPETALSWMKDVAENVFFSTDPRVSGAADKYGNAILATRFGEGVTAEKIEALLTAEKSGYLDLDSIMSALDEEGESAHLFKTQAVEIAKLKEQNEALADRIANPDKYDKGDLTVDNGRLDAARAKAAETLDTSLTEAVEKAVSPFRDRAKWQPDSTLTKIVTENVVNSLKGEPEYKDALTFAAKGGSQIGLNAKLFALTEKAKARFGTALQSVQRDLKAMTEAVGKEQRQDSGQGSEARGQAAHAAQAGNGANAGANNVVPANLAQNGQASFLSDLYGDELGAEIAAIYAKNGLG